VTKPKKEMGRPQESIEEVVMKERARMEAKRVPPVTSAFESCCC
jgi:hypothetical protein